MSTDNSIPSSLPAFPSPATPENAALSAPESESPPIGVPVAEADVEAADPGFPAPAYPVFYDVRRRRWPWVFSGTVAGFLLAFVGLLLLIVSVVAIKVMPTAPLPKVAEVKDIGNLEPILEDHQQGKLVYKLNKDKKRLAKYAENERQTRLERNRRATEYERRTAQRPAGNGGADAFLPPASVPKNAPPVVAGFYVNWDETSRASIHRNVDSITHFIPEWLHLKPAGSHYADPSASDLPFVDGREKALDRQDVTPLVHSRGIPILPLLNNYTKPKGAEEGIGQWDKEAVHEVLSDPAARANVISRLQNWLLSNHMQGINIDFEEMDTDDRGPLVEFMKELYTALHPHGLLVTQDVELENEAFDIPQLAQWNDWIVPMFYDEHAGGTEVGPVAGIDWTAQDLKQLLAKVPAGKIVMGVGNHGYDWPKGSTDPTDLTYQSAVITAKESQPDAVIHLAPKSLNPTFSYAEDVTDAEGRTKEVDHTVWMQDAVSVYNQLRLARPRGIRGAALWYMGAEDPSLWSFFNKRDWSADWGKIVAGGALDSLSYGGQGEVDFEGEGELLQPTAPPSEGRRTVRIDPKTGYITSESYLKDPQTGAPLLPSSWVVRRYGGANNNAQKKIVLTFDDGPDPTWTPRILDILQQYHVPAAFFVVGKQAEENPDLVRREWDQGEEIGNHSWSHPDLFKLPLEAQKLQLNATQRIIEAITGHSTTLFRPPYGGDVEPQTGKEVVPMLTAAELGYITVGETNDPQDWRLYNYKAGTEAMDPTRPRDYEDIVKSVVVNRDVGTVVLLHDGGGDRSRTVAALPQIITQLRQMGYTFMTVSDLRGLPRTTLMPVVTGRDTWLAGADRYIFDTTYLVQRTLSTLFMLSLVLGISRIALFLGLALIQRVREKWRVFPAGFIPPVSVVIAAYNEEKVIARTVQALLDSAYPDLEIIVVDDGSKDRTAEVVRETFASEPRVRVFRKENGGKASALNRGILAARGQILIALDADTLFTPDTISRLVRHFADPRIGAVSGNVRVGNADKLLTKWQSLEYTTSQNFDRRGYDLLNCITVVPGAVGALRRAAVMEVGGYTSDTLAEDTDLTWKLRRAGWRIVNDNSALAYTEAPETLRNLAKQRYRWAFGTLQCLWKHRFALGQQGAFGWLALPSLWLYQILFPAISPFMDIAIVWSLFQGNFAQFGEFYLLMFVIELVAAAIAIRLDRGNPRLLPWLFFQRFVYRQLMYYVILKSLVSAVRGGAVGWNKFERTGTARIEGRVA
ncbi:MAG TPA: glycosyltransferase [Chthonomonadaceae bacterium]|nr:glycosyltransferase [Chthonomonadaceae bacterium]